MANVLVIEPNDAIRKLVASLLRIYGHSVRTAATEEWALRCLSAADTYDCVILGSPVGARSGTTLLEQIAVLHPLVIPRLIVMTTAVRNRGLLRRAAELRVFAITAKPFDTSDLVHLVELSAARQQPKRRWYAIPTSMIEVIASDLPDNSMNW